MGKMTKKVRKVSLTPVVAPGKIRVVLSWPDAPSDLDLYSIFKTGKFTKCMVFFGKTSCSKTQLDIDNRMGGRKGAETITIEVLEKYIYTFAVRKYVSTSVDNLAPGEKRVEGAPMSSDYNYEILPDNERPELLPNITLSESTAKVSIFVAGFKNAIQEIVVPLNVQDNLLMDSDKNKKYYDWWLAFCLNGTEGMNSIKIVNKLTSELPKETYCEGLYNTKPATPAKPATPPKTSFIEMNEKYGKNNMKKVKDYEIKI